MAKTVHIHLHDFAGAGFRTQQGLRSVTKDCGCNSGKDAAGYVVKKIGPAEIIEGTGPHGGEWGCSYRGVVRWFKTQKLAEEHAHFEYGDD